MIWPPGQKLSNFLVAILVQTIFSKRRFEINWPLVSTVSALKYVAWSNFSLNLGHKVNSSFYDPHLLLANKFWYAEFQTLSSKLQIQVSYKCLEKKVTQGHHQECQLRGKFLLLYVGTKSKYFYILHTLRFLLYVLVLSYLLLWFLVDRTVHIHYCISLS